MTTRRDPATELAQLRAELARERERSTLLGREVLRLTKQLGDAAALMGDLLSMAEEAREGAKAAELLDQVVDVVVDLDTKRKAQQRGNHARRVVDDGFLEEASARHLAGEKWPALAFDYGISSSRLRELVKVKGLPTRRKR